MELGSVTVGPYTFVTRNAGPAGGEGVLLLHGFPQSSWEWRAQLAALGDAGYRAVAPDQRGYSPGARPPDVADYTVGPLVGDVLGMADALGFERFHLVGHDWGAAVAWQVAARHGDRVATLTAVSVPHPVAFAKALGDPGGEQARMSSYMEVFRRDDAEDLLLENDGERLVAMFENSGIEASDAQPYVDAMFEGDAMRLALHWYRAQSPALLEGLGPVTCPTLFVWGAQDPAIGRMAAEGCAAEVAGPYTFVELPDVGHWVPELAPEFTSLLVDFVRAHPIAG